mgnify:CR=1 FL=1|jgi:hypothetical protein
MDKHIQEIYSPRYQGERFSQHRMPLDLLEDLETLQKMTIDMAKFIYLEQNEGKKRVPRNFTHGISLELEGLGKGSTIPKIVITALMSGLFPQQNLEYFKQASVRIIQAIENSSDDFNETARLPQQVLSHFNRLGNKLQDDELIEFRPDSTDNKAVYNKENRKKLIIASSQQKEYNEDTIIKGIITAVDKERKTFELKLLNGQKIKGNYDVGHQNEIMDALNRMEEMQKVIIFANGRFNQQYKLMSIDMTEEVILLDPMDVATRMEELALLSDGWMNGEGKRLPENQLAWLSDMFDLNYNSEDLPLPATFPTLDGNIQFEWSLEHKYEVTLFVDLNSKLAHYHQLNIDTDVEKEDEFDLNESDSWYQLNILLVNIVNNKA